jgi:MarR family transcriptional regulator, organic hydroperoxide resistance regulator
MATREIHQTVSALLAAVCRAHRNRAATLLGEAGVYVGQEWILFRLRDKGALSQSELAAACDVEMPTMSKALQRLERAGIVQRESDSEDARVARVSLTREGRALCKQVEHLWHDLEHATVANLSSEERTLLRRVLLQVRDNLTR